MRKVLLLVPFLLLAGCARHRPTPVPLRTVLFPGAGQPRMLVVLLPGRRDRPEDFRRAAFPELAARSGVKADMIAVDAHLGYYLKGMIVDRLHEDVIAPARQRYRRIWLVGVSIGGTGSLSYAERHPENVDGIVLLAPFLGDEAMIAELQAAGGMRGWKPPEQLAPDDHLRRLWSWLKPYASGSDGRIPLFLGYGMRDSFAKPNGLLAAVLPPERVFTVPGGHDWKAWRALWEAFLSTGALQGSTRATAASGLTAQRYHL